jgi:NAD(P)-dependent dehydrogenase (short-subunit alcohol dehydrogenase family)
MIAQVATVPRPMRQSRPISAPAAVALVGFLAGPDAAYITGQVVSINGGLI